MISVGVTVMGSFGSLVGTSGSITAPARWGMRNLDPRTEGPRGGPRRGPHRRTSVGSTSENSLHSCFVAEDIEDARRTGDGALAERHLDVGAQLVLFVELLKGARAVRTPTTCRRPRTVRASHARRAATTSAALASDHARWRASPGSRRSSMTLMMQPRLTTPAAAPGASGRWFGSSPLAETPG